MAISVVQVGAHTNGATGTATTATLTIPLSSTGAGNTLAPVYNAGAIQGPQAASQTTMFLRINLAEPWRKSYAAVESRAWPTAWPDGSTFKSFQLELTCATGVNNSAGATGYTINVYTVTDTQLGPMTLASAGNPSVPITNMLKIYRNTVQYVAAGDLPVVNLIKTSPGKLALLEEQNFLCAAGDDIGRIVATADSRIVRDVTKGLNDILLVDHHFNAADAENADRFTLCYDYTDLPTDGLALSTATAAISTHQTTLTLNNAAAANKVITVLSDVYGPID